jgi:hypothetical protein
MDVTSPVPLASGHLGKAQRAARACHVRAHRVLGASVAMLCASTAAGAYTATLNPYAPQEIYLQVGVGSFTNDYIYGGQPGQNTTINTVSVNVAPGVVGNGTAQAMTTNSTQTISFWDGYTYCNVPAQLYIGGFYRTAGASTAAAQINATVPASLVDSAGDTIPFSTISWTSSGNGDSGGEPFPAGTFVNGGVQTVGTMASNTWNESCWTFSYRNATVPRVGTYTGVVLYTMSSP